MKTGEKYTIFLEKIVGSKSQIEALYDILTKRKFNISSTFLPSFIEHKKFVVNHPYRFWYLIKVNSEYVGTSYILDSNCLGISLTDYEDSIFSDLVSFMIKKHKPLKEMKSVRPPFFFINISPLNHKMHRQLKLLGANNIQVTYSLEFFSNPQRN